MSISVPEINLMYKSSVDAFKDVVNLLDFYVTIETDKYKPNCAEDIKGFAAYYASKVVKLLYTLTNIIESKIDYTASCILLRSIIDNIAIFKLIYVNQDKDEIWFRHLLFIIDGLEDRSKRLPEDPKYDGKISKQEFEEVKENIISTKQADKRCIDFCLDSLKNHPFNLKNKKFIENIIEKRNWKFKSINLKKDNQYSYQELYNMLGYNKSTASYFSFLSQYVHGLGISNIVVAKSTADESYEYINYFGFSLTVNFMNLFHGVFPEDRDVKPSFQSPLMKKHLKNLNQVI